MAQSFKQCDVERTLHKPKISRSTSARNCIDLVRFDDDERKDAKRGKLRQRKFSRMIRRALAKSPAVKKNAAEFELVSDQRKAENDDYLPVGITRHRGSRYWKQERISPYDHLWQPTPATASTCYLSERNCRRQGYKLTCLACHIAVHMACASILVKTGVRCKPTFWEGSTDDGDSTVSSKEKLEHHWVHRSALDSKCSTCHKSFAGKLFGEKEAVGVQCVWCKFAYHNKPQCFNQKQCSSYCSGGSLCDLLVPPHWIQRVYLHAPNQSFKDIANARNTDSPRVKRKMYKVFIVTPTNVAQPMVDAALYSTTANTPACPLLIFVNPKSGGNKGAKILDTLCWLLNPRQIFDIIASHGPKYGLDLYRRCVGRLRILVCGGDGTVGWVLSVLDQLSWPVYPPIAILPLGTGNDLSRAYGWGGVFSDEPLSSLLKAIAYDTETTGMDRWRLEVSPNLAADPATSEADDDEQVISDSLPLTVMNNYFSIGADAHVALQFHAQRTANPEMFNSRLKNRIFYGGIGTVDLFKRAWKDLCECVTLCCDDEDITPKVREGKFHCILFLNIPYYAGGTTPWGQIGNLMRNASSNSIADLSPQGGTPLGQRPPSMVKKYSFQKSSINDGQIEVLGFTTATLAALQLGGRGERLAQCSKIKIITSKPIPAQVDGEPCRLAPSIIDVSFHSNVPMLRRLNPIRCPSNSSSTQMGKAKVMADTSPVSRPNIQMQPAAVNQKSIKLRVMLVALDDYLENRDNLDVLKEKSSDVGVIDVDMETDLSTVRALIARLLQKTHNQPDDWQYLDCLSHLEEGVLRVNRNNERHFAIVDICNVDEAVYILRRRPAQNNIYNFSNLSINRDNEDYVSCTDLNERHQATTQHDYKLVLRTDAHETLL